MSDMKRSFQIMQKKFFHGDEVIDDVTGWQVSDYIYVLERLPPAQICKDNVSSIKTNFVIVFLCYANQKMIRRFLLKTHCWRRG